MALGAGLAGVSHHHQHWQEKELSRRAQGRPQGGHCEAVSPGSLWGGNQIWGVLCDW